METRNIIDYLGNIIGQLTLPDNTTEEEWVAALYTYSQPHIITEELDLFGPALVLKKESMIGKDWSSMDELERKIVLGLTLTQIEVDNIIEEFSD